MKVEVDKLLSFADPRVATYLDAWRVARKDALVPLKQDFDPLAIPSLLRFVWIYRLDAQLDDFICLLAGEEVNRAWGRSIKGEVLRTIVGTADHATVKSRWLQAVNTPAAIHGAKDEKLTEHESWRAERLILPLRSDTGAVDHVLGLSLYRIAPPTEPREPLISEDITIIPCTEL